VNVIGITNLMVWQGYLERYLAWAVQFATDGVPDEWSARMEFGVVMDDGSLIVVVPLVDVGGTWVASGIGPRCHADAWTMDGGSVC